MNSVYIGDPYAATDAEHQRRVDEEADTEAYQDRIAAEILDGPELFDEACGEFDEMRQKFIKECIKCHSWSARNDREETEKTVRAIDRLMIEIAWAYAPQIMDKRKKDADEH